MIIVPVKNSSSLEQALKQYKLKVYKTKQLEKLRERQEFVKKSVKRRSKKNKAIYLQKKFNHSWFWFFFLFVKKSIEVNPKVPKANRPIVSIKIVGGLYFPQLKVLMNKLIISERLQSRPINLLDEIPPLAPSIIFLKKLIIIPDLIFLTYNSCICQLVNF